jgi:uncharacterized protein YcsI (UPF0317 family)
MYENPTEVRGLIRQGKLVRPTTGMAPGYAQANLVILSKELAFDFLLFCQRNPKPCPLLEVMQAGEFEPAITTPGADIRTDIARYRIYRDGVLASEEEDIKKYWTPDFVTFLVGCSFTFESPLLEAGIPLRHIAEGKNVAMYTTNLQTAPAGFFSGPMVVSMRPVKLTQVVKAVQITSRFPQVHGAPVHIGSPETIGVYDIMHPDYGEPVEIKKDEVPVFWACGVTPQAVALKSKPPLMISHSPGYMFITDIREETLAVI